ncbi:multidrug resistance-associated protein 4 [Salvia divinorum]|uniref:Multidrug resistance-associated protein 4 n=1 Tax=Salvia divinorum TaxID=28513 RepID=A0ABD1GG22_SALDI
MGWITSLSCSIYTLRSFHSSSFVSTMLNWLESIFLAPCLLRIRFMAIDLIFLLSLLAPWLKTFLVSAPTAPLEEPLIRPRPHSRTTLWYKATVSVTALLALAYAALGANRHRVIGTESWSGVKQ